MKHLSRFCLIFVLIYFVACNKGEVVKNENGATKIDASVTPEQKQIGFDLAKQYEIAAPTYIKVYVNEKKLTVLEVAGPVGKTTVTAGMVLHTDSNGRTMTAVCTQSCTSVAPCEGCSLHTDSDCSGYCECSHGFGGSCTHTVTSTGGG